MNKEAYNNVIINDAVEILKNDGVIVVPTDTVYGFAIDSTSEIAIHKIYEIKKRDLEKKLPLVVDTYDRLVEICDISLDVVKRLKGYFPGGLTLVLKKKYSDDTVAVRMINSDIINSIISKLDRPLMLTSANISGEETCCDLMEIVEKFDGMIDMVIAGASIGKVSSTIVQIKKENEIELIREGKISFDKIKEAFYRR